MFSVLFLTEFQVDLSRPKGCKQPPCCAAVVFAVLDSYLVDPCPFKRSPPKSSIRNLTCMYGLPDQIFYISVNFFMEFVICECPVSNTLGLALTFLEIFAKHPIYINFASGLVYIYKVVWSCKICKKEKYSQLGHFGWISGFLCGSLGFLYLFAL